MMAAIEAMPAGDVLLLHACCHNPTGVGFTADQWGELAGWIAQRGVLPFVDLAYQGLGDGLEADIAGLKTLLRAVPEAFIAYSCDKNFGLYRDRVRRSLGAGRRSRRCRAHHRQHAGAGAEPLVDAARSWRGGGAPHPRIAGAERGVARRARSDARPHQPAARRAGGGASVAGADRAAAGMFALLPLEREDAVKLRERHGIYMAESGRINVAGLREDAIPRVAEALISAFGRNTQHMSEG